MHVAFGRVRRKSRIVADYADYADYRLVRVGGNSPRREGLCGIYHKLAVCGTKEGLSYEGLPTEALVAIVTVALLYHPPSVNH